MHPDTLEVPQGRFRLGRVPDPGERSPLRAWDAADEYLLHHLGLNAGLLGGRFLVVNDGFGALALALSSGSSGQSWSDSVDAFAGLRTNAVLNEQDPEAVGEVPSTLEPEGPFGLVLVKIPKSLDLLEHQLRGLRPILDQGTHLLGAGMARHMPPSVVALFESILGPSRTSRAVKKARLIHVAFDPGLDPGPSPFPRIFQVEGARMGGSLSESGLKVLSHAGVFSSGRLDRGTRLLLETMPETEDEVRILDLGCGNGILGTAAAAQNPEAEVWFTDGSYLAIASAEETFRGSMGPERSARFLPISLLDGIEAGWADLILNNPPFHDKHTVGDAVAWAMFKDSRRVLRPGGALYVVGNRHLGYHAKLKRIFGNCTLVASDPRFVVLRTVRT